MRSIHPVHRGIVAVAIEHPVGRAVRTNTARDELRGRIRRLLETALTAAGIRPAYCELLGGPDDGLVALIRPVDEVPKTLLLGAVVPELSRLVAADRSGGPLRLRVAVHSGEVHRDGPGVFGEALDVAFRVLEAPRVREYARAAGDPVTLAITEEIFWSVVRHGYPGIEPAAFAPLTRITSGRRRQVWIHMGSWQDGTLADVGTATAR
jgi:hypothetical protein